MLRLVSKITIGTLVIPFVHALDIDSSWQTLTDTCTIKLPRNIRLLNRAGQLPDAIKVGDRVVVQYGYAPALRTEFTGYVVGVKEGPPCEIQCEDEMWLLKRKPLTHSWGQVSLQQLLEYVRTQSGHAFEIQTLGATDLGKFVANKATGAQILDSLRKDYGIRCFFRGGVLIAGDPYQALTGAPRHQLAFRRNVISSDLQYVREQDVRVKIRAISHVQGRKKGRKRLVAEAGDKLDGELRTYNYMGLDQAQLQARADAEAKRLRFDGYRGTVTTFGEPLVEHGHVVTILDPDYPARSGDYAVDKVTKSFGVGGSRRVITLGPKA
ncbi:hypothetical protein LJ737_19935 [Hymenobacter sp. 15J16-1T3B]|uniref:hypothetical protein n=1 Tax=Hymenobacter sp. 15J16-1T3B TaxID=2886941 RepID=UPI001D110A01|nr:hypothetical protein [Hymenobacter sp. 15J16-1T3B]MCC3159523.1 hypothetical protein [Hymenobacter sp. 15J16-1T3B]